MLVSSAELTASLMLLAGVGGGGGGGGGGGRGMTHSILMSNPSSLHSPRPSVHHSEIMVYNIWHPHPSYCHGDVYQPNSIPYGT